MAEQAPQDASKRLLFLFNKENRTADEEQELNKLRQESLQDQLKDDDPSGDLNTPAGGFSREDNDIKIS